MAQFVEEPADPLDFVLAAPDERRQRVAQLRKVGAVPAFEQLGERHVLVQRDPVALRAEYLEEGVETGAAGAPVS
jgi:hypothetical protein